MIRLQKYARRCECGESWGVYYSTADAVFGGRAIPLGLDNNSLEKAIANRPEGFNGQVSRFRMWVDGLKTSLGRLYAFAYGHRAAGAMNVDEIANDRAKLMKATRKRAVKSKAKRRATSNKKKTNG